MWKKINDKTLPQKKTPKMSKANNKQNYETEETETK